MTDRTVRTVRRALGSLAACLLLAAAIPRTAVPEARASGKARTANTILAVSVGGATAVAVGADEAVSERRAGSQQASARFRAGAAAQDSDDQEVGSVEREGSKGSDSGEDRARHGHVSIPGMLSLTITDATAAVTVRPDRVASAASARLGSIDLLGGLVLLDGLRSESGTEVTGTEASVTRSITLDRLSLFDLGELLDRLGVDPLALTCRALEDAGAVLGAGTGDACEHAAAAGDALDAGRDALDAAEAALEGIVGTQDPAAVAAARDQAAGTACGALDPVCTAQALGTLVAIAAQWNVTISDPTNLDTTRAEVVAGLTDLYDRLVAATSDLGAVRSVAADAADGTCDAVEGALDAALAEISARDPGGVEAALELAATAVADACALLRGTLDDLLDTPLLSLDDVRVGLTAVARRRNPVAEVDATVGSFTVGLDLPVQIPADIDGIVEITHTVEDALGDALEGLGIDLPTPDLDLFVIERGKGRREDGTWFADASVTTLRLVIPSATLDVGDPSDLAVLGDLPVSLPAARAAAYSPAAAVSSPRVAAAVGTFDAGATYAPVRAGVEGERDVRDPGKPGTLPVTGTSDVPIVVGLTLVSAAALLRRLLAEQHRP